jgi:hypothetical protein
MTSHPDKEPPMDALLIIIAILVVVAICVAVFAAVRARRRKHLRQRFGQEYDRTIDLSDSKRDAERDLVEREKRRDDLDLRELSDAERSRYREQWDVIQATFVDRPHSAVRDADILVARVMRDRGYPVDDFEQQADLISVDHPDIVSNYRTAHDISVRNEHGDVTTEDERSAMIHYRALFDELLGAERHVDHRS